MAQLLEADRNPLRRILVLVPHEPSHDPRIAWVTGLCASVARTDVIGSVWSNEHAGREYDGSVYIERANVQELASDSAKAAAVLLGALSLLGPAGRYLARDGARPPKGLVRRIDHQVGAGARFLSNASATNLLTNCLARRGAAVSVAPSLIVCHDVYALAAAVKLKARFDCPVIYDSHELWPEADLLAETWERSLMARWERRLIGQADLVVTVSPQLARHLERFYGLSDVLSVPNAEPFDPAITPSFRRPHADGRKLVFLLQGQVAPGRGIDLLLDAWAKFDSTDAVLELRCPPNPYLDVLRARFAGLISSGAVVIREPVRESELVSAAAKADVGIIPYVGPNLNHIYACPNKLSQYMHAGLVVLANDLEFVSETLRRYDCGVTYRAEDASTLVAAVATLLADRGRVRQLQENGYEAARAEFNWAAVSEPYAKAIRRLIRAS